ncbi:MAG: energy transducer TonB [Bacteroidetes bacterium]|nr:energy transducer TonB [Bacteroidota bacterium]
METALHYIQLVKVSTMQTNQLKTASLLDILFDGRNKEYGAYELRTTYPKRIKRSLLVTFSVVTLIIGGSVLANSMGKTTHDYQPNEGVILTEVNETKQPEKLPDPPKQPEVEEVKTEKLTPPVITPDEEVETPPTSQEELVDARIGLDKIEGKPDDGIEKPEVISDGQGKGLVETKPEVKEDEILSIVEIEAKFKGNWQRFLLSNLRPDTPIDNGAPVGRYSVIIRFVVDKEGNVSDITPLTSYGYGMEQEAIRVLKMAANKWDPAIQNGYKAKAYHKQMITFEVGEAE